MNKVKVKFLRTVDGPHGYFKAGTAGELPDSYAKELASGKRPSVEIVKESKS